MAEIEKLKRVRASARAWMTRAVKGLEKVLKRKEAERVDCVTAMEEVDRRLALLDEAQSAYELELDVEEFETDFQEAAELRETVEAARVKATKALISLFREATSADGSPAGSQTGGSVLSQGGNTVKLPKPELPQFSGQIMEWQPFWETFSATVGAMDLPEATKFS